MSSGQILDKKTQTTDMSTRAVFMLGQPDTSSNIKGIKMKWWERRMDVSQWRWSLWSSDFIFNHSRWYVSFWFTFFWAVSNTWRELLFEFIEDIYNSRLCNIIVIVLHFINMRGLFSLGQIPKWLPQWIWLVMPHPSSDSVTYERIHSDGTPYIHFHWNVWIVTA